MINKVDGMFILNCDICGDLADEDFYEFRDAANYKRWNGWKNQKMDGEWEDVCPDCQEMRVNNGKIKDRVD